MVEPSSTFVFKKIKIQCFLLNGYNAIKRIHEYLEQDCSATLIFLRVAWFITYSSTSLINNLLGKYRSKIHVICNDLIEVEFMKRFRFKYIYFNHTAITNENLFSITNVPKEYDIVLNSRIISYKNPHLAHKSFKLYSSALLWIRLDERCASDFNNLSRLADYTGEECASKKDVVSTLNKSKVGLILSNCEGECRVSTEYLLCGLPVVSVDSVGGRNSFYDDYNSIVCDSTEEAVAKACGDMLSNYSKLDRNIIRKNALKVCGYHRQNLMSDLDEIFVKLGIRIDMQYFFNKYIHNPGKVHSHFIIPDGTFNEL